MSAPELYGGIGSAVVGGLFIAFPRFIGVSINRFGRYVWKKHDNDLVGKLRQQVRSSFPAISPDYDDAKVPKIIRFLGVVGLIQAVVFFILSAVT